MTKHAFLITLFIQALMPALFAQLPGELDETFGIYGIKTTDIGQGNDQAFSVALQTDGKLVIAGISSKVSDHDFTVARYNTDGTPDTSFSEDGIQTTYFGFGYENATSLAIQPDGKIVVAGYSDNYPHQDFLVARYNTDGSIDNSFNNDGKLTTTINEGFFAFARSVAIQTDGKILVAGYVNAIPANDFACARYNLNGTLDSSFSNDGILTTDLGGSDLLFSIKLQADGKLLAAGRSLNDFAIARYNTDGALDSSFNLIGKLKTDFGGADHINSIALQPNGKIVAAGYSDKDSAIDFALARYNTDGTSDTTFGNNGKLKTNLGRDELAVSLAIQIDGRIVAAGYSFGLYHPTVDGDSDFALARYHADGTLDSSFSSDGMLTTELGGGDQARSAILQTGGKIVVAGFSRNFFNSTDDTDSDFAIVRYDSDGALDDSFSNDGKLIASSSTGGNDFIYSVAIQPDGMIVTAGSSTNSKWDLAYEENYSFTNFASARHNAAGELDSFFGQKGIQTTAIGIQGGNEDAANSAAIQPDGKIIMAGYSFNRIEKDIADNDFALVRYYAKRDSNNNFSLIDSSFGNEGKLITDFGAGDEIINSLALQPDGKIVAAGYSSNGINKDFALARYNVDGMLDNSFDVDGKIIISFGSDDDIATSVAIQTDGKIIMAGYSCGYTFAGYSYSNFSLARFNTDGTLDYSFGTNGKQSTIIRASGRIRDYGYSLALQPNGKILVAGASFNGSDNDFAMMRYNTDGTLDESFGIDGIVITAVGSYDDIAYSVALQPDKKIVVAGSSFNGADNDFAIARYNADGSPDLSFSTDGKITTPIGEGDDVARAVAIMTDGEIVAAGYSFNGTDYDFALAKYISGLNVGLIDFSAFNSSAIIYPNPITQNAILEYALSNEEEISIQLLDLHGKTLKTFIASKNQEARKHQQKIALPSGLPEGAYLIVISSARGRISIKIIK